MNALQQTNMDYYGQVNLELAEAVGSAKPTQVLEIGCGCGALGGYMKSLNPSLRWDGIEAFRQAAEQARSHLDHVTYANIEDVDLDAYAAYYDTIVMGDLIEHLVDPWALLKRLSRILKRGGQLVMSVPNINHWSIAYSMMLGRFKYDDSGLLDRTHLRFFTLRELEIALADVRLKPTVIKSVIHQNPAMETVIKTLVQAQKSLGATNPRYETELRTFQWLITARK